jgi:Leucine Rich repeat
VHLSGLKRLRILHVDHSKMTDAGLEAIGKLTNLEELWLGGAGFSDRGLAHLTGLKRLKSLTLVKGTQQLTDASLESLRSMTALEHVYMGGWHISDEGIAQLRELKNLKSVAIGLSRDQQDRRNRLQALLPGVKID